MLPLTDALLATTFLADSPALTSSELTSSMNSLTAAPLTLTSSTSSLALTFLTSHLLANSLATNHSTSSLMTPSPDDHSLTTS